VSERTHYPPGAPCWVDTLQPDVDAARTFYAGIFGWDFSGPGGNFPYFVARKRSLDVAGVAGMPRDNPPPVVAWNTHICVESADAAAEAASRAGGTVLVAPFDAAPAGRMAVLQDPAGAVFCIWQPMTRQGAQVVNEPSAWAMSTLVTPDVEGAIAFYGSVFGWQAHPFDFGVTVTLCRLPGYHGGEPQQPVPRDVVAVIAPMGDGIPPGTPPFWNVDFWIDDANAAAERTLELGGKVIVPPHPVPQFLSTTLADPAGATFSLSQFVGGG
jgi:predicted enzyme related to lactoylglutathione lyase